MPELYFQFYSVHHFISVLVIIFRGNRRLKGMLNILLQLIFKHILRSWKWWHKTKKIKMNENKYTCPALGFNSSISLIAGLEQSDLRIVHIKESRNFLFDHPFNMNQQLGMVRKSWRNYKLHFKKHSIPNNGMNTAGAYGTGKATKSWGKGTLAGMPRVERWG